MDHRNRSIKNPDSQRHFGCTTDAHLVKCCALFGVGISLYLGDGLKQVVAQSNYEKAEELLTAQDARGSINSSTRRSLRRAC